MAGVYIEFGAENRTFTSIVGKEYTDSIGEIRAFLSVPSDIQPMINGESIPSSYIFKEDDRLIFTKAVGTKGL